MRKTAVFAVVMIVAISLLFTGCVQKSEHDKVVADLNAKIKAAEENAAKIKADLDAANAKIKELEPWRAIAEKFSKEANVWGIKDGKLESSKVRILNMDTVEGQIEQALKAALGGAGMPKDGKLMKVVLKADAATVTLSKEFKSNFPTDEAAQKLVVGAIVNTATEFSAVKKVAVTTASGSLKVGKTLLTKTLVRDDAALK